MEEFKISYDTQTVIKTNKVQDVMYWEEFLKCAFAFDNSLTKIPNSLSFFGTEDFSHSKKEKKLECLLKCGRGKCSSQSISL